MTRERGSFFLMSFIAYEYLICLLWQRKYYYGYFCCLNVSFYFGIHAAYQEFVLLAPAFLNLLPYHIIKPVIGKDAISKLARKASIFPGSPQIAPT